MSLDKFKQAISKAEKHQRYLDDGIRSGEIVKLSDGRYSCMASPPMVEGHAVQYYAYRKFWEPDGTVERYAAGCREGKYRIL